MRHRIMTQPGIPTEQRADRVLRVEAERRHLVAQQTKLDPEAHLWVNIEPGQAGEPANIAAVRHEADKDGVVDRTDLDQEAALNVPIAFADHGVRREAREGAAETRTL